MAGYFEQVLWDTHLEAVKKVAGQPGYDIDGDRVKIGNLKFSKGTPPFDRDWRVIPNLINTTVEVTDIDSLEGKTVVKQVRVGDSYSFLTSDNGVFTLTLSQPSCDEESAQLNVSSPDWEDLASLGLTPLNITYRLELERLCIWAWDYSRYNRDRVVDLVHKIRGLGDSSPLPVSMRCVYRQYDIPENLW